VDSNEASTLFGGFLTAIESQLALITIVELAISFEGSNVRIPQVWAGAPTYGSGAMQAIDRPGQMNFVGRDAAGHRVRVGMYGLANLYDVNWRINASENAFVGDALTALTASASFFLTVLGNVPIWKLYANIGINDHWLKIVRRG
jgi:hypothetical protein